MIARYTSLPLNERDKYLGNTPPLGPVDEMVENDNPWNKSSSLQSQQNIIELSVERK